ncbi:MAG: hypothetical protein ACJ8CB_01575 [Ktedonobacteraceae bacterium]
MYQRNNNYQPRETGIHTIHILSVAMSVSHQKGSALFVVPATYKGRHVTIKGLADDPKTWRETAFTQVHEHRRNGRVQYIIDTTRLIPGNYYADAGGTHGFERFTITSNHVTVMRWTY